MYGVVETNPITDEIHAFREAIEHTVDFADPALDKIVRLRLLTDPGFPFYDVSYCYGTLKDGTPVRVNLPLHQFPKRGLTRALVDMAKDAGKYGKGMGLLDNLSILS